MRTGLLSQPMKHDNRDEWKKKNKKHEAEKTAGGISTLLSQTHDV